MFKLESYLTPLILNYVDKYIKNLKPEDSQFSLWGGDAAFCNLDLRLDVLEQELQLPFTFVNGHIHELRIHVPWTKLGSEPVIITINTIECILKLSDDEGGSDCGAQKVIQSKKGQSSRSVKKPEVTETPPGYIQGLINRVFSNICIVCNNLILKYVEDDVVLSLNIKSAELHNVNEKWEKTFVDPNLADGIVRKIIDMQDLTVCLDKRDASGKIETYQDPLLYRCSTTWHIYSEYSSIHSKYPSLTRVHMYCANLEFSLTDQQFPMFLRLLYLCVALQNRGTNFSDKESSESNEEDPDIRINIPEESTDFFPGGPEEESWGSWAWSFIPEMPSWSSINYEEQQEERNLLMANKIFQFGIFISKASCTLKQTVLSQDTNFCSSPKCTFVSLMVLHFYGCSMEFTSKGKDFVNIQAGVSGATITGLEDCVCGYQDFSISDNERQVFMKSGVPPSSGHVYSYLSSSLFDPLAPENCGQRRKYFFNPDKHLETLTEEVMVQRFPAFAFDYLYELEIPEDFNDRLSTVTASFLEESNWHERAICRWVFGPLCIDITSSFVHRLYKLLSSLKDYDYPSYSPSRKLPTTNPVITSDIVEQLEEFVPSRQYHLTVFKPVIRLFIADHHSSSKQESKKGKKKRTKPLKLSKGNDIQFYFEIFADCMDIQATLPMYPSRLATIVSSHPSQILLHHCYSSNSMKLFGLEISLGKEGEDLRLEHNIIERTSLTFFKKTLILPEKLKSTDDLLQKEYSFECTNLSLRFCKIRFLAAFSMFLSWTVKYLNTWGLQKLKFDVLNSQAGTGEIFGEMCDIKCSYLQADKISFTRASVTSFSLKFQNEGNISVLFHAPELTQDVHKGVIFQEKISDDSESRRNLSFLQFILQMPEKMDSKSPPLLILHISGSTFYLEPAFLTWLSQASFPSFDLAQHIDDELFHSSPTDLEDESTGSSITLDASISQTLTKSQSTIVVAGDHREFHKQLEDILLKHLAFLSNLSLEIEIGSICGLLPNSSWCIQHTENSSVLYSWNNAAICDVLKQAVIINFPSFKMRNNNSTNVFDKDMCTFPIKCSVEEKKGSDCFPWNLQMDSFCAFIINKGQDSVSIDYLLQPTAISATIAITSKSDRNQMSLCVHMDSKYIGISLSTIHTTLLIDCIRSLSTFSSFGKKMKTWISYFHLKSDLSESTSVNPEISVPENNFPSNCPVKADAVNEKVLSDDLINESGTKKLTLWSQLTLSKLSLVLLGKLLPESKHENFKIHFDIEEIISSLDIQDVYSKFIVKLTSVNSNCFISRADKSEWKPGPFDGVILFCNDAVPKGIKIKDTQHSHAKPGNQPSMMATYTKALCANVKEKWMSHQDSKEKLKGCDYISEIDIKLKSFDFILWPSLFDITYQILIPFIKLYQPSSANCTSIVSEPKYPSGINFCSHNLPLLYIRSNIIQLYLPDNSLLTDECERLSMNGSCDLKENANDVLMLQINYITLTSQVENPLPRIILDAELYNAAVDSESVSLPGAAIEDRQYQMDINGFALGSLSGKNMLWNKNLKKDLTLHHPLTMGENPALEWNIGVMPENRNISSDSAIISPIISPLNIRILVAPAIVCDNPSKKDAQNKLIIAGISFEISVTSDIYLYLNIDQTCFIYSLLKNNIKLLLNISSLDESDSSVFNFHKNVKEDVLDKQDVNDFPFVIPSCFTHVSSDSGIQACKAEKVELKDFVPFEILLTTGTISIMLFYHEGHTEKSDVLTSEIPDISQSSDQCQEVFENQSIFGRSFEEKSKASQIEKNTFKPSHLHPFLCICITQPHSYVKCQPSSQKFESSCFDLQLCGSSPSYVIEKPHESCVPVNDDFLLSYIETKPGEPNAKTGIPPSFFTVSCADFLNYPANIKVFLERPVKFNLRMEICDSAFNFIQHFQSKLKSMDMKLDNDSSGLDNDSSGLDDNSSDSSGYKDVSPVSSKPNLTNFFKNVNLYTTQVVIELISAFDNCCQKLVFNSGNIRMESRIETFKDGIKSIDLKTDVSGFTLQFCSSNEKWSFLQPLTFSLKQKCHVNPWFQIEIHFTGESMLFNLSFHHLRKLNLFLFDFQEQLQEQIKRFKSVISLCESYKTSKKEKVLLNEGRKQYWSDDLRKGFFQFIQACDYDSEPKALEIVFNRASSVHPASMTWRYPEPRVLTKIEVSPVPFQCEEGKSVKDRQVLTCYLQYWNSAKQEYLNLCDFMLSETEHNQLDLPDLTSASVAVSDKWRVLLDCKSYIDDDGVVEIESPCLSPLALAACMSIDSCFDPSLIPFIQIQASFDLLKVSLYNYFDKKGCSPVFYPFVFDEVAPKDQEFAILSFMNPSFSCTKWSYKLKISFSSGIIFEVLEFRNLTVLPIISPVDIICNASIMRDDDERPVYDLDLVLHPCFIRVSQSVVHTLTFSTHLISKVFVQHLDLLEPENAQSCSEYVLPIYYFICNNIQECIRFGQVDTEEYIILSPLKMHAYSWWCHKKKQMLRVSFGSSHWKWSEEFSIDIIGVQTIMVDNNFTIIVSVKYLNNLQKQVVIDGQLIVHSELSFPIQLKFDFPYSSQAKIKGSNSFVVKSVLPESTTPTFVLPVGQSQNFKLSLTGILDSQLWSEEVSFDENKLIKIPWKNSYQNVWCQLTHQMQNDTTFVAVFICPLFILRSNLPIPLDTRIVPQNADESYTVELHGKGQEVKLLEGSEWDHKLDISFYTLTDFELSVSSISVSIHDLSKITLTSFENIKDLKEICYNMQPRQEKMWPYSFLDRICHPVTAQDMQYPCFKTCKNFIPATMVKKTNLSVKVDRLQHSIGLNTLLIDIKPHVMIINRLRMDLYFFDPEGLQWVLPPNSIAIPSNVHETFRFGIKMGDDYLFSHVLTIENLDNTDISSRSNAFSFPLTTSQYIPQSGSVNILIKLKTQRKKIFLFKLISEVQEGIVVITAFPVISLLNKSGRKLYLSLTCLPYQKTNVNFPYEDSNPVILSEEEIYEPLLFWNTIPFDEFYTTTKQLELNFYIGASVDYPKGYVWSYPVCLDSLMLNSSRHTLAIPFRKDSKLTTLPMAVSSHKWKGMLLLVLDNDPSPMLLLHNQTSMRLFYGQSVPNVEGKSVYEECHQDPNLIPLLCPDSSAHYSFPVVLNNFPFILHSTPMICLGSETENGECIWSAPFYINIDKQFVHILGLCDFMIHCRQVGHTVYLHIDPVNRIELTAKEIRCRIELATSKSSSSSHSDESETVKVKSPSSKAFGAKRKLTNLKYKAMLKNPTSTDVKDLFILYLNFRIVHASLILCDEFKEINKSCEVMRINVDNAVLFSRPEVESLGYRLQEVYLCFEQIQLDNQIDDENNTVYDFPVILQRHVDSNAQNSTAKETVSFMINKVKENSVFILHAVFELPFSECNNITVQSLNVKLQPISLYIEDSFYYRVIDLVKSYDSVQFHNHTSQWLDIYYPKSVLHISRIILYPIYFQELRINIPEITLSLHASLKLYLSLENSVLKFQPFEKDNLFTTSHELGRIFVQHYLTGALFRAGWVIGSLDLLGNPAGFARAVGGGVTDFVYLPYKGLLCGPRAFISGLSSGALSLFTQISSGAIMSITNLASSISRNMDYLCLDSEHLARQEILRHHLPQGVSEGLIQGLSGLGLSLLSAVAGIANHPLKALMSPDSASPMRTASGIVGGLGKGLIGVLTKPIGGTAGLLSQTGYGLLHGAGWRALPKRQYQPVTLGLDVVSSSCLKYACKITQCASLGEVLVSLEATYANETGEYEKNILLLTTEALCILAEDEITLQRTFALSEIGCKEAKSDRSTLVVIPSAMYRRQVFVESCNTVDRVVEYVLKSREENQCSPNDVFSEFLSKSTASCHVFYLYPKDRSLFMTLFSFAKNKAMGKGFFIDC